VQEEKQQSEQALMQPRVRKQQLEQALMQPRARAADGFNVYAKECSIDAAAAADDGLKVQGKKHTMSVCCC